MKWYFLSFVLVAGTFVAGFYGVIKRHQFDGINRDPAALHKSYDFSHLSGEDLLRAAKTRLIAGLKLDKEDGVQELSLGHFAFEDQSGTKKFACEYYDRVQIIFEADGVASGGRSPQMILEGRCGARPNDLGHINPLVIPIARITGDLPADGDYKFSEYENQLIQFKNMADQWPKLWVLKKVTLSRGVDELIVPAEEVGQLIGRPVIVKF